MRRPLSALLGEVAQGAVEGAQDAHVAIRNIEMDLPIDLRINHTGEETELLGDVPLFLTRTDFDAPISRLFVRWSAQRGGGE